VNRVSRQRLDKLLVSRGLASSRERACALIDEGKTLQEVIAADPTGGGESAAGWVGFVYEELRSRR